MLFSRILVAAGFAFVLSGAGPDHRLTYPAPPRVKHAKTVQKPGLNVPEVPESGKLSLRVTNKPDAGKTPAGTEGIRVVGFDQLQRGSVIGSVAEGTTLDIVGTRRLGSTIYYAFHWDGNGPGSAPAPGSPATLGWVSGRFLEAVGQ